MYNNNYYKKRGEKMKKNEIYLIKYKSSDNPYYQIVNGSFRFEKNAMKRVEEIRRNNNVSEIVVNKRVGYKSAKIYSWSNGFEVSYLNRNIA